jgi:hypothetical protein
VKETAVLSGDEAIVHVTYECFNEHGNIQVFYGILKSVSDGSQAKKGG